MSTINTYQSNEKEELIPSEVSCNFKKGIGIFITGLQDNQVKESLLRVFTTLYELGYQIPGKKIEIDISPIVKNSNSEILDVAIALAILAENGKINVPENIRFTGQLNLNGTIIKGISTQAFTSLKELIDNLT